jgi:shikimate dehydrogenase
VHVSGDRIIDMLRPLIEHRAERLDAGQAAIVIGLIGRGIQSSRSPVMHEREGARLGMRYTYALVDFDKLGMPDSALGDVIEGLERLGFAGFNVTHPFKQTIIPHLTGLADEASAIGAVNTVVLKDGARTGHNTDCWGFAESFRDTMADCPMNNVVQLGAGGAGAAVSYALMELGVTDLTIIDSDHERAERLSARMVARFGQRVHASSDVEHSLSRASGIVNTTPVGMAKYPGMPFPANLLSARHWVAEIIYFPQETELLRRARALGCRTLAGTGMAVYQAVRAFELFTGVAPDRAAMVGHFEAAA